MSWKNVKLIFLREVRDQLRDRRTLFMVAVLPLLLYPSLGIGLISQLTSVNEQTRTVVALGANDLPQPALIDGDHFVHLKDDHLGSSADAEISFDNIRVVTPENLTTFSDEDRASLGGFIDKAKQRQAELERLAWLQSQLPAEVPETYTAEQSRMRHEEFELRDSLQSLFDGGKVQVLIVFPADFNRRLTSIEESLASGEIGANETINIPAPVVIYNGANEKSGLAFSTVASALRSWERELLSRRLRRLDLPSSLPRPVQPVAADLAQAEELAANMWSKLFPALLVMMSVTGAFYPAVDLGAGEKERGTMETLLISPATRTEIVLGKFFTVMLFSLTTALLNVLSMGITGLQMASQVGASSPQLGDMSLPSWPSLMAVVLIAIPLASLFSALSLAIAMFARSSKEGQYYLSPLLMATLGLTMFCSNPTYELDPYKSVLPVIGPALLLKALLLGTMPPVELLGYTATVLAASAFYSGCAIWWAIELFQREDVLFREVERFDPRLWIRHLLRDKEPTPTRGEAVFCFVIIAVLQFVFMMRMPAILAANNSPSALPILQTIYLIVTVALPPALMAILLTSDPLGTLRLRLPSQSRMEGISDVVSFIANPVKALFRRMLRRPGLGMMVVGFVLPIVLLPISLELINSLSWFFPPAPPGMDRVMEGMQSSQVPVWLSLVAFAVAPAFCEELAFRGFILSGLQKSRNKWVPIIVSAVLFGMIHLIPKQIFNASLLGLVLGLLAVRSRSLWPGVIFHLIYNGMQVGMARMQPEWLESGVAKLFFTVDMSSGSPDPRFNMLTLLISGLASAVLIGGLIRRHSESEPSPSMNLEGEPTPHAA
ncbi:MAG: CPBP family intramembrane metalloprotease [Planctomycetaceae bacterium]|nr:CPBP family intramembrane metalloprotease [Planctomycetaceae bacterium]